MLAIVLLGTGFFVLLQVMSTGLFAGSVNENEIIAANLIQEKIEELRNTTYAGISSEVPPAAVDGFPVFTRGVVVTSPETGLKQASVTVYWYARNDQMSMNMVTYVSDI